MSSETKAVEEPMTLGKHTLSIDHVAIAVHHLEESVKLFTKVLGFEIKERRRTEGKQTAMISAVLRAGPITVVLLQGTSPESQVSRFVEHFGPGVQHLAISVQNLPQMAEELKGAGLEFDTTVINSRGLRQIFSKRDAGSGMMFEFADGRRLLGPERTATLRAIGEEERLLRRLLVADSSLPSRAEHRLSLRITR